MSERPSVFARHARTGFMLIAAAALLTSVAWALRESAMPPADFTFANGTEIKSIDPHIAYGQPEGRIVQALFEGLTNTDPHTLEPTPGVAERWEISEDGLRYTFHLRRTARWSDGQPVTAADFVWSFRRLLDPETAGQYAGQLWYVRGAKQYTTARVEPSQLVEVELPARPRGALPFARGEVLRGVLTRIDVTPTEADEPKKTYVVQVGERERQFRRGGGDGTEDCKQLLLDFSQVGVKASDDYTLELTLENPTPYFLSLTGFYTLCLAPRTAVEKHGYPQWTRPEHIVTNGPFHLQSRRLRDRLRLVRSESYWGRDEVRVNVIDALAVESPSTALNLYLTGATDWITTVPPTVAADLVAQKRPDFLPTPEMTTYFYRLNVTQPPLDNPKVRRALAAAVNKRQIVSTVSRAGEVPARSFVPPGLKGYEPAVGVDYDLALARRLLTEAGYPGGEGLPRLSIMYNTDEGHQAIAEYVQDCWKRELGIDVELQNQEWGAFMSGVNRLEYTIARAGWIGDYADPNTFLSLFTSNSTNNNTGWRSPRYDELLDQAARERDPKQRFEIMRQAEAVLLDESPIIPVYFRVSKNMVRPYVQGFYPNVRDVHPLREISVDAEAKRAARSLLP